MLVTIFFIYYTTSNNGKNGTLLSFAAFDTLFYSLSGFVKYGYRLSYFFLPFYIIFIPRLYNNIKDKKNKKIYLMLIIVLSLAYWYIRYVHEGYDGTVPYFIGK
jgi:uncharacterized protein with PQ loop repeat